MRNINVSYRLKRSLHPPTTPPHHIRRLYPSRTKIMEKNRMKSSTKFPLHNLRVRSSWLLSPSLKVFWFLPLPTDNELNLLGSYSGVLVSWLLSFLSWLSSITSERLLNSRHKFVYHIHICVRIPARRTIRLLNLQKSKWYSSIWRLNNIHSYFTYFIMTRGWNGDIKHDNLSGSQSRRWYTQFGGHGNDACNYHCQLGLNYYLEDLYHR